MEWNSNHGSAKGWRFNPKVLRWACYVHAVAGSAAYKVFKEVLHLPSESRIQQLRQQAAPLKPGTEITT